MLLAHLYDASMDEHKRCDSHAGLEQMKRLGIRPRRVLANARVRESSDSGTAHFLVRPGHSFSLLDISFATGSAVYPLAAFPKSAQSV
jgi:hypothetical protein